MTMDSLSSDEEVIAGMLRARAWNFNRCASGILKRRIAQAAQEIVMAFREGKKVLVMGNGGSAAEAQHFAAELMGRFERDRPAMPILALTVDTSFLTAQANDAGFETVFARQVQGLGRPGDVVVAMTTSDVSDAHSRNIEQGLVAARHGGLRTVLLCSVRTAELLKHADVAVVVPNTNTAFTQEVHLAILHIISLFVEREAHG